MEFLRSFLRRHFAAKPVVASRNVGSFLRPLSRIDLVTVFDAILTSRQTREKLQCLYENLMSNNFRRMAVLKKI